ncbi:MAG: RluA family pseudouridine synthase [Ruminococcaceae bacterium]|nr:RluA family pseudouridine synthase [Oscillospiraceae bacterium]
MLKILFENKDLIVCLKPAGVLSQGSAVGGEDEVNMLSLVSRYIGREAGLIHRLDRGTAGVMVFSKRPEVTGVLSSTVSDKEKCVKEYLAVVSGEPEEREGEMADYLFKDAKSGKSFVVDSVRKGAKRAELSYKVIDVREGEKGKLSLVLVRLFTGRTHQIRVQFSSRGMPIAGDGKYGSRERVRGEIDGEFGVSPKDTFALFAHRMSLDAGKNMRFDVSALPDVNLYPFSLFADVLTDNIKCDNIK